MSEAVKGKPKAGNLFKIIIIVLLALLLIGVAAFAGVILGSKGNFKVGKTVATSTQPLEQAYFQTGEEFTVNLADTDTKHYVKTAIYLAYDKKNKALGKELTENVEAIRDAVISVLRSKKSTELTPKGGEDLKKELMDRIDTVLTKGRISNVYYDSFIVQ